MDRLPGRSTFGQAEFRRSAVALGLAAGDCRGRGGACRDELDRLARGRVAAMRRFPRIPAPKRPGRRPVPGKCGRLSEVAEQRAVIDLRALAAKRAGCDAADVGPAEIGWELRELLAQLGRRESQP